MVYRFRPYSWGIAALATLMAASCSDNRAAQCNRLTEVTNKTVGEVQTVVSATSQPSAEALLRVADSFDQGRQEMEALSLSDEQLQVFQGRFVTLYQDVSTSARTLADALSEQNFSDAQRARSDFQTATEREAPLVEDVNAYCGAIASPSPATPSPTSSPTP